MLNGKKIAVTIPCYNEETQLSQVIKTMPDFVDEICIVDDCSKDRTFEVANTLKEKDSRLTVIKHQTNGGVGKAIATGYKWALAKEIDVTVVMAGDAQMDPRDLERVILPVAKDEVDYVKGNRFFYDEGIKKIPRVRLYGNAILSALTKIVSGYWHVSDTQCGYTAINLDALASIDIDAIYPRYGCPNDILTRLNIAEMRVAEVAVNPLYKVGENSKMNIPKIVMPMLSLLWRLFWKRMMDKYILRTGHPLVLAYCISLFFLITGLVLTLYVILVTAWYGAIPKPSLIVSGVSYVIGIQLLLSAFEMDYNDNSSLCVKIKRKRIQGR